MSNLTTLETTLCESNWDIILNHHSLKLHDQIANVETTITGIFLKIHRENLKSALCQKHNAIAVDDGLTHIQRNTISSFPCFLMLEARKKMEKLVYITSTLLYAHLLNYGQGSD